MQLLQFDNIEWNLPFLVNNFAFADNFINKIIHVENSNPVMYLNGSLFCKWNGGELANVHIKDFRLPKCVEDRLVIPVFSFSKYNITDEDLKDPLSNHILDIAAGLNAEFEVSSDKLAQYIRSKYPNARMVASYIKSVYEMEPDKEVDFYNRTLDYFDRVILLPSYVKSKFLSDASKFYDQSRIEIIVNDRCVSNCSCIKSHLESVENNKEFKCCPKNSMDIKEIYDNSLALSIKEIENIIKNTGVVTFSIKGRNLPLEDARFLVLNYLLNKFGVSSYFMYIS